MAGNLYPHPGISLTGGGVVVSHDETRHRLRRLCIRGVDVYPDVGQWCALVKGHVEVVRYEEKQIRGACLVFLWVYWKEA